MTVYVDDLVSYPKVKGYASRYGRVWCHMGCDGDLEELHLMADKLDIRRRHFQNKVNYPHYDLIPSKRARAILAGAVAINSHEWIEKCRKEIK